MANQHHMSLEAMLDQERKDVLKLLQGEQNTAGRTRGSASSATASIRAPSPYTLPRSPVRSMLDIDVGLNSRRSSVSSVNGTGRPQKQAVRSMLDITTPPPKEARPHAVKSMLELKGNGPAVAPTKSAQTSPVETNHRAHMANSTQHRSMSDAAARPAGFGPRASVSGNPESTYQFSGYLPSNPGGPVVPKRNTQAGKKSSLPSAMADAVRGGDLLSFGRDRGRHHSIAGTGIGVAKSRSPAGAGRLGVRSNSPKETEFTLDDGKVIDMHNAYRKLSDANLALSSGDLKALGKGRRRTNSENAIGPSGHRLQKDYIHGDDVLESSDEANSSDEDGPRGRRKNKRSERGSNDSPESKTLGMGRAKGPRTAQSLMAAAEDERAEIAEKYKVKSLFGPQIEVTAPSDLLKHPKPGVHPYSSFDEGMSGFNTPVDSETEADISDIKRAQRLSINMTPIVSTPVTSRCVRTIYRGDFAKMQQEALDNQRRVRKYLVATDLSDEAAHALEWTIGTVIRDGDTLLAIYCVDEEIGISPNDGSAEDLGVNTKEQVDAIALSTKALSSTPSLEPIHAPSALSQGFKLDNAKSSSASASPMGRERGKAEQARYRAVQDITDRVSKLLRKTKLQVKVVIEVIHCKSPKHLITEVIDYISPTLVILGSRGRSALKGVILGSFSNYLVTKSSVPVMVARKRLRKHTKYKRPPIKLANNLNNPNFKDALASARID